MPRDGQTRVEFAMREDDAELLAKVARARFTTVSELVRQCVYAHLEPLGRAKLERDERMYREVAERRKLREWNGQTLEK